MCPFGALNDGVLNSQISFVLNVKRILEAETLHTDSTLLPAKEL